MRHVVLLALLAGTLIAATRPPHAGLELDLVRLLSAKAGSVKQDQTLTKLRFTNGDQVAVTTVFLELTKPDRAKGNTGQSDACAVLIAPQSGPAQAVATVGSDPDTYAECGGVVAIGRLPAAFDRPRFAVIYRAIAMSREQFKYSFFLVRDKGRWQVDEKLMNDRRLSMIEQSIPEIRRVLQTGCAKGAGFTANCL